MRKIKLTTLAYLWAISFLFVSNASANSDSLFVKAFVDGRKLVTDKKEEHNEFYFGGGLSLGHTLDYMRLGFDCVYNKNINGSNSAGGEFYAGILLEDIIARIDTNLMLVGGSKIGGVIFKVEDKIKFKPIIGLSIATEYAINRNIGAEFRLGTDMFLQDKEHKRIAYFILHAQIGVITYF